MLGVLVLSKSSPKASSFSGAEADVPIGSPKRLIGWNGFYSTFGGAVVVDVTRGAEPNTELRSIGGTFVG